MTRNVLGRQFIPLFELCVLKVDVIVKDSLSGRESWCLKLFLPPVGEFFPVLATILEIESSSEAPDAAENEHEGESLYSRIFKYAFKKLTQGHNHADLHLWNKVFEINFDVPESFLNVLIKVALKLFFALIIVRLLL